MLLVADFGGTTIKLGLVHDGSVIARGRLDAQADQPLLDRLEVVACEWEAILKQYNISLHDCAGVALALPFLVDPKGQRVLGDFAKFPGAAMIDFAQWSKNRLGLPIAIENDLRVALLGEWTAGAARGKNNVLMVALGTGIGCAVISEGRLLRGANNRAAALLGHSTIAHEGAPGRCGNIGCAEDLASTATLATLARARSDFNGSQLAHAPKIDYATVFALTTEGDVCSSELLRQSLNVWAVVIQNAILAYDPEMVVLGGGVLRSRTVILPALTRHLHEFTPGKSLQVPLVASALGDDAALLGGEALVQSTNSIFIS